MRVVIQRVSEASVTVDQQTVGAIGQGLMVLLGVAQGDRAAAALALLPPPKHRLREGLLVPPPSTLRHMFM